MLGDLVMHRLIDSDHASSTPSALFNTLTINNRTDRCSVGAPEKHNRLGLAFSTMTTFLFW